MLTLILGGSGSGKSAFAEETVLKTEAKPRFYVATMECFDEESRKRVLRHQAMRSKKEFQTIECPTHLEQLVLPNGAKTGTVLLECMSNLVANEMYGKTGRRENAADIIWEGILRLKEQCSNLVIVSNDVFCDGETYDASTTEYMKTLGLLNIKTAGLADEVYEVVYTIPVKKEREV